MANMYDKRRAWKWAFLLVSVLMVILFLYVSNDLVKDMSEQERGRMEIWAQATKQLATAPVFSTDGAGGMSKTTMSSYSIWVTTSLSFAKGFVSR